MIRCGHTMACWDKGRGSSGVRNIAAYRLTRRQNGIQTAYECAAFFMHASSLYYCPPAGILTSHRLVQGQANTYLDLLHLPSLLLHPRLLTARASFTAWPTPLLTCLSCPQCSSLLAC